MYIKNMARYVKTIVQITNIFDMRDYQADPPMIILELKELDDEKAVFHHGFKLYIKEANFPFSYKKNLNSLKGKKMKLILED